MIFINSVMGNAKTCIKSEYFRRLEDGGQVGGSWTHLLVPPARIFGWSSDKRPEQSTESQMIWIFEAKEYRGCFVPSGNRFLKLSGQCPMWGPSSRREISQKMQLSGSLPSQSRALVPYRETTNPNWESLGRIYQVWKTKATHTASSMPIAAVPFVRVPERNSI